MAELFSDEWINALKDEWNNEPEVSDALAKIDFSSVITCGYKNEDQPRCVFVVENGVATRAGLYNGETPDWDMRADEKNWGKWTTKPLNMASMGLAFTTGKLKFNTGDFKAMIKNPSMAVPFVKSFALMTKI
ncbi:MAG: SCP-2 sterol transfer family protein [Epsilonproteobacteria bacterium]|nr:SCP-2 sterol transfer family protein [Campylobacterota bacterium]